MSITTQGVIFVVDDESDICELVSRELERYGHRVKTFITGTDFLAALKTEQPDISIIDLGLPDMDGLELVRQLDDHNEMGLIILSGRDSLPDRVLGLELGADDYISKPFDPRELVARSNSILRRLVKFRNIVKQQSSTLNIARFDRWSFHPSNLTLKDEHNNEVALNAGEAHMLVKLLQNPQRILKREQLMAQDEENFDRVVDVRMSRLRRKLEVDPKNPVMIKTIYGLGYMLTVEVEWQ